MKKLLIPAMGVAAAFGAAQPAAADVQLAQLMIQGQPGFTGNLNRTLPSGSAGIAPLNTTVAPSPFTVAPSPSFAPPSPFIGERGDLNAPEFEAVGPAERDANGKLNPSVDRARARFAGDRGPDGKLLPTYGTDQAQATSPAQTTPQATTPSRSDMPSSQPSTTRRTGTTSQSQPYTTRSKAGSAETRSGSMSGRGHNEEYTTSALNALSAQGYSNFGRMERVGNMYQTTAMKGGRQVNVQVDPETGRVTER